MVVIANPKQSHVEILQIAGRACRTSKDKPCGYVLVPVHGSFGEEGAGQDELEGGAFGTVVNVLQTFRERDEQLQQRWRDAAVEAGRTGEPRLDAMEVVGPYVTAVGFDQEVLQRVLGTALLRFSDPWDVWLGRLVAYKEENGDCMVPHGYVAEGGFALGTWVGTQRQKYKGKWGGLSDGQRARLEELGMVWEPQEAAWEEGFRQLAMYREEHDDCTVPRGYVTEGGFALGNWVNGQRYKYKRKMGGLSNRLLSNSQKVRLEELGMVWACRREPRLEIAN